MPIIQFLVFIQNIDDYGKQESNPRIGADNQR